MKTVETALYVEDTRSVHLSASSAGIASFVKSGFGLSIHWGLYSLQGRGEWVYFLEQIPRAVYRERVGRFCPVRFEAEEWADLMVEAGMKFLLITSKHHDGFCLWDTQSTEWNISRTPWRRDVLSELSVALRDRGIALHFYYSLLDWTRPEYRSDWPAYVEYYQGHLRELCTRFGKIGGILFDGYWPRAVFQSEAEKEYLPPRGPWDLAGTYDLIHSLQPDAVVCNNHHVLPLPGEDYQIWEQDMPGENSFGGNTTEVGRIPRAAWWNLNKGWAYAPATHELKECSDIAGRVRATAAVGDVFMLNVGPRPWGDIHPAEQAALRSVGSMLRAGR